MVIFSTLVYHCGTPRYMEPHILGWRPLMLRLIYFLFLRPSLLMSMCNLWPPLISLWPPLISLWQQHINIFLHFLLQRKTCCKSGDGGVSLSCRTSPCPSLPFPAEGTGYLSSDPGPRRREESSCSTGTASGSEPSDERQRSPSKQKWLWG
ncbi:unnamed protein product [Boreogadus saida]